jgi:hypothetical protein
MEPVDRLQYWHPRVSPFVSFDAFGASLNLDGLGFPLFQTVLKVSGRARVGIRVTMEILEGPPGLEGTDRSKRIGIESTRMCFDLVSRRGSLSFEHQSSPQDPRLLEVVGFVRPVGKGDAILFFRGIALLAMAAQQKRFVEIPGLLPTARTLEGEDAIRLGRSNLEPGLLAGFSNGLHLRV